MACDFKGTKQSVTMHSGYAGPMCTLALACFPLLSHNPTATTATLLQGSQERLFTSDKEAKVAASSGPCGGTTFSFQSFTQCGLYNRELRFPWAIAQLKTSAGIMF